MAITVRQLVESDGLALKLLAGEQGTDRPIRWVHVSELEDPTPWLKGGEVVLTTGMNVGATTATQRAYVQRMAEADLAGLGFGAGFSHQKVPKAMVDAAEKLGFPLFEVPYPVPFIAITEAVSTRVLAEQYDVLTRAVDAQHVLTRAVMEGQGVSGVADSLAQVIKGWSIVFDLHGMLLAATTKAAGDRARRIWEELRGSRPDGTGFSLTLVDAGDHVWIQPVGAHGRVEAFLVVGKSHALSPFDRIVAGHALSLLAIELSKERAIADAQRRMQGDFFQELADGALTPADGAKGLARFGFDAGATVSVLAIESAESGGNGSAAKPGSTPGSDLAWAAEDHFSRSNDPYLISPNAAGVSVLLQHVSGVNVGGVHDDIGGRLGHELRVGASSPVAPTEVGRALREARYALQVCRLEGWGSAGFEDLGTYRLLLSMADPDALRAFADSLLAPLDAYDVEHDGDLVASLRAFLEHNARWETASSSLGVHRHTLRYRMRKVEELTGREMSSSFDRMEFWLAVRARELQQAQVDS
ncbi:MAG: PucR family transcriptional regulator ligand-binding domain-containing protein [Actinomycetota bacterium]